MVCAHQILLFNAVTLGSFGVGHFLTQDWVMGSGILITGKADFHVDFLF
jgi:hypothetical protein